jgi:hypothetical protein
MIRFGVSDYGEFLCVTKCNVVSDVDCISGLQIYEVDPSDVVVAVKDRNVYRVYAYSSLYSLFIRHMLFHPESRTPFTPYQTLALRNLLVKTIPQLNMECSEYSKYTPVFSALCELHRKQKNMRFSIKIFTAVLWSHSLSVQALVFRHASRRQHVQQLKRQQAYWYYMNTHSKLKKYRMLLHTVPEPLKLWFRPLDVGCQVYDVCKNAFNPN